MSLAVSLGKCESCLNGGTEYDGFGRLFWRINSRLLANARTYVNRKERFVHILTVRGHSF